MSQLSADFRLQKTKNKPIIGIGESLRSPEVADSDRNQGDFVTVLKKLQE